MKVWHLRNDIYHIGSYLMLEKSKDVAREYLRKKFRLTKEDAADLIDGDACCLWFKHIESGQRIYFIWIPSFRGHIREICLLGHEVIHLVNNHFHDNGVEPGTNAEAFTYYFDYILKQCLEKLTGKK